MEDSQLIRAYLDSLDDDETFLPRARVPTWIDWFHAAGVDHVDVAHGLTFNTADHALDAASERAGVLLAQNILAYDHLKSGRPVIPITLALPSGRAYHLVGASAPRQDAHQYGLAALAMALKLPWMLDLARHPGSLLIMVAGERR